MAALLIGGLALVGCSSDNDDNHSSNPVERTAALARIDGGTATIAGYGAMNVTGGKFTIDLNRAAGLAKPYTVVVEGGKLMSGSNANAWKAAPKLSAVVFDPASANQGNVNLASELVAQIFAKLPASERNATGYQSVTQTVANVVLTYAKTLNPAASVDNIFGTWSSDNEAVLLAAMTSIGVAQGQDASSVAKIQDIEAMGLTLITQLVTTSFPANTSVADLNKVIAKAQDQISTPEFSAGIQAAQKPYADAVAENVIGAPAPKPVPSDPVLFGAWIFNGSSPTTDKVVDYWAINNSSIYTTELTFRGSANQTITTTNSSASFMFAPSAVSAPGLTGLTMSTVTNGVATVTLNGSAFITAYPFALGSNKSVTFPLTFGAVSGKHQAGTVNAILKLMHNESQNVQDPNVPVTK